MLKRPISLIALVFAALVACEVAAEETHYFPRLRQMQDLVQMARGSAHNDRRGLLGQEPFTAGFGAGWVSDYYWRGFKLFNLSDSTLFRGDAYLNVYGFEASVWGMWDLKREQKRPTEVDYRFRYKFEFEGALTSVGYTFYDFSGSDGSLGRRDQGFGKTPLADFPEDKFPAGIHEFHLHMTYFQSAIQADAANLRFSLNYWQRLDDEGTRIESTIAFFVDIGEFSVFGDYLEIATTSIYQHRYLTNRTGFQGELSAARLVYNLEKYQLIPVYIVLEVNYFLGFHKDLVDGFYFGANINVRI